MKTLHMPRQIFRDRTQSEPQSPKSMLQSIFSSPAKEPSRFKWNYRKHSREPQIGKQAPVVRFLSSPRNKPGYPAYRPVGFYIGESATPLKNFVEVRNVLRERGETNFVWMGDVKYVN